MSSLTDNPVKLPTKVTIGSFLKMKQQEDKSDDILLFNITFFNPEKDHLSLLVILETAEYAQCYYKNWMFSPKLKKGQA